MNSGVWIHNQNEYMKSDYRLFYAWLIMYQGVRYRIGKANLHHTLTVI